MSKQSRTLANVTFLLLAISLALSKSSSGISVNALKGDNLSINLKDNLEYDFRYFTASRFTTDQVYARINSLQEAAFGNIPSASKVGQVVYSWWEFVADQKQDSRRLFIIDDQGTISEMVISSDKPPVVNAVQKINISEFKSVTPLKDQNLITSVTENRSEGTYSVTVTRYTPKMDKETLRLTLDIGKNIPSLSQTQLLTLKDTSQFFLTFDEQSESYPKDTLRNKIYWQQAISEGSVSGILELSKSSNFVDDAYYVHSVTTISNPEDKSATVYIGYRTQYNGIGLASCNLTFESGKLLIKTKSDCKSFLVPIEVAAADSLKVPDIMNPTYSAQAFAYFFQRQGQQVMFSKCNIRTSGAIEKCQSIKQILDIQGQFFHSFVEQYPAAFTDGDSKWKNGALLINFTKRIVGEPFSTSPTVIYPSSANDFDMQVLQDPASDYIALSLGYQYDLASLRRNQSYSLYLRSDQSAELLIQSGLIAGESAQVNILSNGKIFLTVRINLLDASTSSYKNYDSDPFSNVSMFTTTKNQVVKLPVARNNCLGNLLDFRVLGKGFEMRHIVSWPSDVMAKLVSKPGDQIYPLGPSDTQVLVQTAEKSLSQFKCSEPDAQGMTCMADKHFDLEYDSFDLIHLTQIITSTDPQSDPATVAVGQASVKDSSSIRMIIYNSALSSKEVLKIDNLTATQDNSILTSYGDTVVFAIIKGNTILVYYQNNLEINAGKTFLQTTLDQESFGLPAGSQSDFQLKALSTDPRNPSRFFVVSTTSLDDNLSTTRVFAINIAEIDATQKPAVDPSYKDFIAPKIQSDLKACSLGKEHIIQSQPDKFISSISVSGSGSLKIDYATYGLDITKSELICIPGSTSFIILDRSDVSKQKYLVVFGNQTLNIQSRYHSFENLGQGDLAGYQFVRASSNPFGLTILLEKQTQNGLNRVLKTVYLDGPFISYRGDTTKVIPEEESKMTLEIISQNAEKVNRSVTLQITKFDPTVKTSKHPGSSVAQKGTFTLDSLAYIYGNVLEISTEYKGKPDKSITFQNIYTPIDDPKSMASTSTNQTNDPPTMIIGSDDGLDLRAYGIYIDPKLGYFTVSSFSLAFSPTPNVSINYLVWLDKGESLNSQDAVGVAGYDFDNLLSVYGTTMLGKNYLNWHYRLKDGTKSTQGKIPVPGFRASKVTAVSTGYSSWLVLAVDQSQNSALLLWMQTSSKGEEDFRIVKSRTQFIEDFQSGDLVLCGHSSDPVLIYARKNSYKLLYRTFADLENGQSYYEDFLTSFDFTAIREVKCDAKSMSHFNDNNKFACTVTQFATSISSAVIKVENPTDSHLRLSLDPLPTGPLQLLPNYVPVYIANSLDLTVVKARAYDADGKVADERMFFYTRAKYGLGYSVFALSSKDYLPNHPTIDTPAIPILSQNYNDKIWFFQTTTATAQGFKRQEPSLTISARVTKGVYENYSVVVNGSLNSGATKLKLADFFQKPYVEGLEPSTYYIIIGVVAIILIILIVMIAKCRKRKAKAEAEAEGQFSIQESRISGEKDDEKPVKKDRKPQLEDDDDSF